MPQHGCPGFGCLLGGAPSDFGHVLNNHLLDHVFMDIWMHILTVCNLLFATHLVPMPPCSLTTVPSMLQGRTARYVATEARHAEAVKTLRALGADASVANTSVSLSDHGCFWFVQCH